MKSKKINKSKSKHYNQAYKARNEIFLSILSLNPIFPYAYKKGVYFDFKNKYFKCI